MGEKWQVTPTGSDPQPSPMVSAKPLLEASVTVTVAFCEVCMVTVAGVTVRLKVVPPPVIVTGCDVDGLCERVSAIDGHNAVEPGCRFGISVATPLASSVAVPTTVVPLLKVTVPVGAGPAIADNRGHQNHLRVRAGRRASAQSWSRWQWFLPPTESHPCPCSPGRSCPRHRPP